MMQEFLSKLAAVIIAYVDQEIHPLVTKSAAEEVLLVDALESYFASMQTTLDDRIEELMLKHKMRLNFDIMFSQFYLQSTVISDKGTPEETDQAYSACTRAFVSAKGLLDQYHTLALRAVGHQI
jgi:hypothetical protein